MGVGVGAGAGAGAEGDGDGRGGAGGSGRPMLKEGAGLLGSSCNNFLSATFLVSHEFL